MRNLLSYSILTFTYCKDKGRDLAKCSETCNPKGLKYLKQIRFEKGEKDPYFWLMLCLLLKPSLIKLHIRAVLLGTNEREKRERRFTYFRRVLKNKSRFYVNMTM